jgi:hypothetical protein
MSVLMIGATEREQIAQIIAWAKAHPIPLSLIRKGSLDDKAIVEFKDRTPEFVRPPSSHILFPGNFRAAFSCEEQPGGFCTHLSVSVEGRSRKGMMPHPAAVEMIAEAFGVKYPADRMWIEEFEPGEFAINLVSMYQPHEGGNA